MLLCQHADINLTVTFIENKLSVSYLNIMVTNIGVKTLRTQDTSDLRHFGTGAEVSVSVRAEVSVRHFGTSAEVSGHFGTGAEMSVRHFGTEVSLV